MIRLYASLLMLLTASVTWGASANKKAGEWGRNWVVEAEKDGYVTWTADGMADIHASGGLTLWYNHEMQGDVTIEYDARIVSDGRVSDLNCFWMSDRLGVGTGRFLDTYKMQLYYVGYGGNYNTTTRFRRYTGDERAIDTAQYRPVVLREYLDSSHLIKPDHWYHIRLEQHGGRVRYVIDGECLVDYPDPVPLTHGYFGFRTTLSHAQLRNFKYVEQRNDSSSILIRDIFAVENLHREKNVPATFGIPFQQGELDPKQSLMLSDAKRQEIPFDQWTLATWPDGTVKWAAVATVATSDSIFVAKGKKNSKQKYSDAEKNTETKDYSWLWIEQNGERQKVRSITHEQQGRVRDTWRIDGDNYTMRIYSYKGSDEIKIVLTSYIDSITNADGLKSLALKAKVPLHGKLHQRKVTFLQDTSAIQMDVKPLISRRKITLDEYCSPIDSVSSVLLSQLPEWDGFRLSQLSPRAFSVRKRATNRSPWIGTIEGFRSPGVLAVSDSKQTTAFRLSDFWQSYPSTLQIDGARSDTAVVSLCLWSPEAESMSFEHYDTVAHGLEATYEDVQPGMSTANGIARTTTIYIRSFAEPLDSVNDRLSAMKQRHQYLPTPEYLHRKRAFGVWSLDSGTKTDSIIYDIVRFYADEQERNNWYGFFNYGDVMHTFDPLPGRGEWRYDVGGYAWDNTELATPAMLWYEFLRTASPLAWRMAEAMTRHNSEVDCYHRGPHRGLGTRHNVLHWGCGAKEARISQAFLNRFLYYLTADERAGDLITEVRDADQLLYSLDPMRLAQPRSERYPCTAPARLRIGPDWLAYAGNWFTEWERTGNIAYRDKLLAGMRSISAMPHGIFSGPKALGYDPATGIITWEGDTAEVNTNHLLSIMGGFEMMNEIMLSLTTPEWSKTWLTHASHYKEKAIEISRNHFRIPRLKAYAYWQTGKEQYLQEAWHDLRSPFPIRCTNDAATYGLDAIFMQEVLGK